MKFFHLILTFSFLILFHSLFSQSEENSIDIFKIQLLYTYGCIADIQSDITIEQHGSDLEIHFMQRSRMNELIMEGKIPKLIFKDFTTLFEDGNILELNDEYFCEIETTGDGSGRITFFMKKEIRFLRKMYYL